MRLLIACAVTGCYSPSVAPCQYACAAGRVCPEGLTCSSTGNMCVASTSDTCSVDSGIDGSPPTPCTLFAMPTTVGAPGTPQAIAITDVNGDAYRDIVVGGFMTNEVALYLGPPSAASVQALTGSGVMGLAIAQAASGKEVVLSEQSSPNDVIQWFPVSGNGFATPATTPIAPSVHPGAIAVANLDPDAYPDLAVAETNAMVVTTLSGTSAGGFALGNMIPVNARPLAIAAAALDSDTFPDLVVLLDDMTYQVVLDNGASFFPQSPVAIHGAPAAVQLADLDADRNLDLVVASGSTVSFAHGNADGTFGELIQLAVVATPRGVAIGDFDRDGKPDIAVTSSQTDAVFVIEGNGDGTFRSPVPIALPGASHPWAIAAGDLDGDGHDDLAVTLSSAGELAVLLDTCTP